MFVIKYKHNSLLSLKHPQTLHIGSVIFYAYNNQKSSPTISLSRLGGLYASVSGHTRRPPLPTMGARFYRKKRQRATIVPIYRNKPRASPASRHLAIISATTLAKRLLGRMTGLPVVCTKIFRIFSVYPMQSSTTMSQ